MTNDTIARTLANFVGGLRLEAVPDAVSLRARYLMLDAIGCALAARREPFALKFSEAAHALADGVDGTRGVIGLAAACRCAMRRW